VLGPTPWRQTVASTLRHSLLLFGPTLSGKTLSFVIPTVPRWRGPVIATSSKVDLLLATITWRRRRGRVCLLDPFRASGMPSIRWSPLVGSRSWAGALDMVYWLTQAASVSHYAATGTALDPPLLVMLDEAANIALLRELGTYASSLASQGVQLVAVFQNFGQIKDRYGNQASTIMTNFLVKVLMGATRDRELLDLLTYLISKEEVARSRSPTAWTGPWSRPPPSASVTWRRCALWCSSDPGRHWRCSAPAAGPATGTAIHRVNRVPAEPGGGRGRGCRRGRSGLRRRMAARRTTPLAQWARR
jgi:type IV secretory pathway TraG/TraD family ATPase VirD4